MSTDIKTLLIEIHLDENLSKPDLELRYILVDTIESRDWGEVVEETSSPDMLEVVVEVNEDVAIMSEKQIRSLLTSLGFSRFEIKDISEGQEEE